MTTFTYKTATAALKPATWQDRWQRFVDALSISQEPQVWQDRDREGKLLWYAYDPVTDRSFSGSEAELRSWIESRYAC